MKKALILLLALLVAATAVGCIVVDPVDPADTDEAQITDKPADKDETAAPTEEAAAPTEAVATEAPAPADTPEPFEEITVFDTDDCLMKITGIDPDGFWGYTLEVYMENRTSDRTLMYSVKSASVNGVEWDPLFASEVAPGKKMNSEMDFTGEETAEIIGDFTDIELTLRVYDSDDWDDLEEGTVHVYPFGEDRATVYVREPQPGDTVIADNEYITAIVTGYDEDGFWGYAANLYLVNKTDMTLLFGVDDVSVNGFMCDPFWATSVGPGNVAFSSISWDDSDFEDNGISEVEEIEMRLSVIDDDDWFDGHLFNETITLNP